MALLLSPRLRLPSAVLRSSRTQLVGSGIGSVDGRDFREEIPKIAKAVSKGAFDVRTQAIPLSDVATAWTQPLDGDKRIVFLP